MRDAHACLPCPALGHACKATHTRAHTGLGRQTRGAVCPFPLCELGATVTMCCAFKASAPKARLRESGTLTPDRPPTPDDPASQDKAAPSAGSPTENDGTPRHTIAAIVCAGKSRHSLTLKNYFGSCRGHRNTYGTMAPKVKRIMTQPIVRRGLWELIPCGDGMRRSCDV